MTEGSMSKTRGTVKHSDLEGGRWELHADDGEVYDLEGAAADIRRDGLRVEVDGQVEKGMMSISMRGGVLRVKKARTI
jgi:hypothetical protein